MQDITGSIPWTPIVESTKLQIWPQASRGREIRPNNVVVVLAWLSSCMRTNILSYLSIDCPKNEYENRLNDIWGRNYDWLNDFEDYREMKLFDNVKIGSLDASICLTVHTQKATLTLDLANWNRREDIPMPARSYCLIRDRDRRLAGFMALNWYAAERLEGRSDVEFIALSVCAPQHPRSLAVVPYLIHYLRDLTISELYGCPCAIKEITTVNTTHIEECPRHTDFATSLPWSTEYRTYGWTPDIQMAGDSRHAVSKFFAPLSYLDINVSLLHDWEESPTLIVMLVAPRSLVGAGSAVYEKLGIGEIYLERWVEASSTFESIVLT
jgi:hypothetical protein